MASAEPGALKRLVDVERGIISREIFVSDEIYRQELERIPQSHYQGFRGNEYVRIVGFILRPSRRIQAFELYLVSPWYPKEPP